MKDRHPLSSPSKYYKRTNGREHYCGRVIPLHRRGHFCFKLFMESLTITGCTTPALDRFEPVPKILSESFRGLICDGNMPLWPKAMSTLRGE